MSETGSQENQAKEEGKESPERAICRDFLNKVCNRGTRCKFYHPPGSEGSKPNEKEQEDFNFCIDYQNQGCYRASCRFVHAPQEEIERYRRTGDVSVQLARAIAAVSKSDTIQGIPFCKEFQSGRCQRGQRCRYWHVNVEHERERRFSQPAGSSARMDSGYHPPSLLHQSQRRRPAVDEYEAASKRANYGHAIPHLGPPAMSSYGVSEVERENAELKRELDSVRRELLREKERYDALLAAISHQPSANASVQSPQQAVYHDPYNSQHAHSRPIYPGVHPVPAPKADWYSR